MTIRKFNNYLELKGVQTNLSLWTKQTKIIHKQLYKAGSYISNKAKPNISIVSNETMNFSIFSLSFRGNNKLWCQGVLDKAHLGEDGEWRELHPDRGKRLDPVFWRAAFQLQRSESQDTGEQIQCQEDTGNWKAQLKTIITRVWMEINSDKELCKRLMQSIPARLEAVIAKESRQVRKEDYEMDREE